MVEHENVETSPPPRSLPGGPGVKNYFHVFLFRKHVDKRHQSSLACRPGAGEGARRTVESRSPRLRTPELRRIKGGTWDERPRASKLRSLPRPREQVARPRALKGVDPGRRWDSPSPLLGGAWPGRCSLRCLRRRSSDSGSRASLHPSPGRAALGLCLYLTKTSCCAAIGTCIGET